MTELPQRTGAQRHATRGTGLGDLGTSTELFRVARDDAVAFREVWVMEALLAEFPRDSVMLDVGAHHGSELKPFLDRGWRIYAFEPDPVNRAQLNRRIGRHPRLTIDARAVSETHGDEVAFFRSNQSTGISTLAPFHESHFEASRVSTVRLDRFCADRNIDRIDYLKVDTEGHDLFVLKSLNWDLTAPAAIQVEFEDSKTVPLGYDFHDLAGYLLEQGYDVWVSEWHPVIAYGSQHDWCRLARYPTELENEDGWGNLLAFRDPVSEQEMRSAAELSLSQKRRGPVVRETAEVVKSKSGAEMGTPKNSGTTVLDASAVLRSSYRRPSDSGISGRLRELMSAYEGLLAIPAVATLALYVAAVGSALLLTGTAVSAILLASAGTLTLGTVGIGITRARRERLRTAADLAERMSVALERIAIHSDGERQTLSDSSSKLHGSVDQLVVRMDALDEEALAFPLAMEGLESKLDMVGHGLEVAESELAAMRREIERLAVTHQRKSADLATDVTGLDERCAAMEERLSALDAALDRSRDRTLSQGYQRWDRSLHDDDFTVFIESWGPRLGSSPDAPPAENKRHLLYLSERIRVAEERSIGRLATSTQDMVLRMLVARAAARDAAARQEPLHILEIGTLFGVGLGLLGEACRGQAGLQLSLTAVDPLSGYYSQARPDILTGESVDRDAFLRNLSAFPFDNDHWRIIQRTNREAREEGDVADRSYGMVVLDGDHSFEEIRYDFEEYRDLMGSGCYVVFDDYGADEWPDVAEFVDRHVSTRSDVQFVGSSWRTAVVRVL